MGETGDIYSSDVIMGFWSSGTFSSSLLVCSRSLVMLMLLGWFS